MGGMARVDTAFLHRKRPSRMGANGWKDVILW